MCLAVYQRPGAEMEFSRIINAWENNPDGGGFAYFADDGSLQVYKTMDLLDYLRAYEEAWDKYGSESSFIQHMRWATHGTKDEFNVHPFAVDENTVVAHNGIIRTVAQDKDDKRSDTQFFVDEYLKRLPPDWADHKPLFDMVEKYIGGGNKLVILTNRPGAEYSGYIVNQSAGHWKEGIWFSNYSYMGYGVRSTHTSTQAKKALESKNDVEEKKATKVSPPATISTKASSDGEPRPFGVVTVGAGALVGGGNEPDGEPFDGIYLNCALCGDEDKFNVNSQYCSRCDWCSFCDKTVGLTMGYDEWHEAVDDNRLCDCYTFESHNKSIHEMSDEEVAQLTT